MKNQKSKIDFKLHFSRQTALFALIMLIVGTAAGTPITRANTYQEQINQLQAENAAKQQQTSVLQVEADGLEATIGGLQAQINGLQGQIDANTVKSNELQNQITAAQAELDQQKRILGINIKQMYLEGDISTIEMLATSKDLSDYFDKQQYRDTVKNKIKDTLDRVTALKSQLKVQQSQLNDLIAQQTVLQGQLSTQKGEQNRLLGLNQDQRSSLDAQMRANYANITELRRQQQAAIRAASGNNGSSAVGSSIVYKNLTDGQQCGGGYPYCDYGLDEWVYDPWGLSYARECVHYVAWKLSTQNINVHLPGNGGGNANNWAGNLSYMATIDNNPVGAQMVYLPVGSLGHVAIVERDNGDGWVHVSQYNWYTNGWGNYSEMDLKVTSNLLFFHF